MDLQFQNFAVGPCVFFPFSRAPALLSPHSPGCTRASHSLDRSTAVGRHRSQEPRTTRRLYTPRRTRERGNHPPPLPLPRSPPPPRLHPRPTTQTHMCKFRAPCSCRRCRRFASTRGPCSWGRTNRPRTHMRLEPRNFPRARTSGRRWRPDKKALLCIPGCSRTPLGQRKAVIFVGSCVRVCAGREREQNITCLHG